MKYQLSHKALYLFVVVLLFSVLQGRLVCAQSDTLVVLNYLDSGDVYEYSNPDQAIQWYLKASHHIRQKASDYTKLNTKEKIKMLRLYALSNRYIGVVYRRIGKNKEALYFNKMSLRYEKVVGNERGISMCMNNIGLIYFGFGDYENALDCYQVSEKYNNKLSDSALISGTYTNIGQLHEAQKEFDKALEYYMKSLAIKETIGDTIGKSIAFLNIGNVSYLKENYTDAEEYYVKALELFNLLGDIQGVSMIYTNLSFLETNKGNNEKALDYLTKAYEIDLKINDITGIVVDLSNISNVLEKNKQYLAARDTLIKAEQMALTARLPVHLKQLTIQLSDIYKLLGDKDKALEYFEKHSLYKDSLYSVEKSKRLAEMEVLHETEKKQLQIENLTKEQVISDLEIERQNLRLKWLIIIIVIIVLALSGFVILMIRLHKINKARKLANIELSNRNDEIVQKNSEILAQRDEIDHQKAEIEKLYSEVTDSIIYAKRIQMAILPSSEMLTKAFPAHFVFYRPKDIVGGDFYYAQSLGDFELIAVADCTGHGVPGGFMSMMGMAFLREIVNEQTIADPAAILNHLRQKIIDSLQQTAIINVGSTQSYADIKVKDGMDMGIVSLNRKTNQLMFSGANIPCVVGKKGECDNGKRLIELKGSRMPVSVYVNMKNFDNQTYNVAEGDCIYLFTDGFADQFGGQLSKKFGRARLYEILNQICVLDIVNQKNRLEKDFISWKLQTQQTDDVTVVGWKV
ncbi:MAG: hypothetical protein CVU05_00650 [Bacteroidetes bacterium HGW-Bacteroidetes-21]|jgi:serine phosphatase RsbU (regulator of sigma subunit)/TPR repeat protein|nr:MAG: hypothetical protein CVU05_00650 [Bacteroidetes bacterium HGW-Bacteroidetes-21]